MTEPDLTHTIGIANACAQRIDQGHGKALDWQGCLEAAAHPLDGLTRVQIQHVTTYLAAQVAGLRVSAERESSLVMAQVARAVDEWRATEARRERDKGQVGRT